MGVVCFACLWKRGLCLHVPQISLLELTMSCDDLDCSRIAFLSLAHKACLLAANIFAVLMSLPCQMMLQAIDPLWLIGEGFAWHETSSNVVAFWLWTFVRWFLLKTFRVLLCLTLWTAVEFLQMLLATGTGSSSFAVAGQKFKVLFWELIVCSSTIFDDPLAQWMMTIAVSFKAGRPMCDSKDNFLSSNVFTQIWINIVQWWMLSFSGRPAKNESPFKKSSLSLCVSHCQFSTHSSVVKQRTFSKGRHGKQWFLTQIATKIGSTIFDHVCDMCKREMLSELESNGGQTQFFVQRFFLALVSQKNGCIKSKFHMNSQRTVWSFWHADSCCLQTTNPKTLLKVTGGCLISMTDASTEFETLPWWSFVALHQIRTSALPGNVLWCHGESGHVWKLKAVWLLLRLPFFMDMTLCKQWGFWACSILAFFVKLQNKNCIDPWQPVVVTANISSGLLPVTKFSVVSKKQTPVDSLKGGAHSTKSNEFLCTAVGQKFILHLFNQMLRVSTAAHTCESKLMKTSATRLLHRKHRLCC